MNELRTFEQITDPEAVGGKAWGLARLAGAGLPVPPGFCITADAHRRLAGRAPGDDAALCMQIADAYRRLGGGAVAVRSSATAEDGALSSFAGQQETVLGVEGENAVCAAVGRCWASLDGARAVAYRRRQGVADRGLAMAVVVQRLVPAEIAGVLFTRDPLDPTGERVFVEASWGLGEAIVSGRVTPDRYRLDRATGRVVERHVADKAIEATAGGERAVPTERRTRACLDDGQLGELARLGRQVEELFGGPRDVEWAWAEGRFWLLQARPITAGASERDQVRREEIAALVARAEPAGTVWARFNLAEILPEPTPMTWAVVRRLLCGRGGYGLAYRDLGFHPDPALDEEGVFDLVAGRPYCNLSREPRFYPGWLPREHPFAALKADPARALDPRPVVNPARAGASFWLLLPLRLPGFVLDALLYNLRLDRLRQTFADHFRKEVVPPYLAAVEAAEATDLTALDDPALLGLLETWTQRTLVDFARDSLKPTVLAGLTMGGLEGLLARRLGRPGAAAAVRELARAADPEADVLAALGDLRAERIDRAAFLARFGHRGYQEMELSRPRWSEDAALLDRHLAFADPAERKGAGDSWERALGGVELSALERKALDIQVAALRSYVALRELGKHHLLRGYAVIRRVLVELDRRHGLHGGVFFLLPEELPRLAAGEDLSETIARRRRRRALALSLEAPAVLFSDDLEALGRPLPDDGADSFHGVPLSAGVAEGVALVLEQPLMDRLPPEFILVCPSTDPAWMPLFAHARGLVMEMGGVLSHGAIVAREYGLPAVAGLPGVQRRLRTGQRLRVDGSQGTVTVLPD